MFLEEIEIENYRSLEKVKIENLGRYNVFIGRNNSGKSSVFSILSYLHNSINDGNLQTNTETLTARDALRCLSIRLVFDLQREERESFIDTMVKEHFVERKKRLKAGTFLSKIEYNFKSMPGSPAPFFETPGPLHLSRTRIMAEHRKWTIIQESPEIKRTNALNTQITSLDRALNYEQIDLLDDTFLSLASNKFGTELNTVLGIRGNLKNLGESFQWIILSLINYLDKAFFFDPFRHSTRSVQVSETNMLTQHGNNLAPYLHTIHNNDSNKFSAIEKFLHVALPDIGRLETPLNGIATEVAFRHLNGNYLVNLHNMGGGIEQLLMVASVLLTTNEEYTLFLEEPESHLHAGAQRYLIEKLSQENRQIFITTHSPIFINSHKEQNLYQVKYCDNRTQITHINDPEALSGVLEDIGVRNSDMLLSDAVLFVEGPSDRDVIAIWAETLGMSLEAHNISVLAMGGSSDVIRSAPVRSDLLINISRKAPVPHFFLLDRDERSQSDIDKLKENLGDKIYFLQRRELENYLIVPRAIKAALCDKYKGKSEIINAKSEEEVNEIIKTCIEGLYNRILVKRVRGQIPGLIGGLLPRDSMDNLEQFASDTNFTQKVIEEIKAKFSAHLSKIKPEEIISSTKAIFDEEWAKVDSRINIAPGEEVLTGVFKTFEASFKKTKDNKNIAKEMTIDEIHEDIKALIKKIVSMTKRT